MMSSPSLRKISRVLGNHFLGNSLLRDSPAYTREMANRQLTPPPATGSNNEPPTIHEKDRRYRHHRGIPHPQ